MRALGLLSLCSALWPLLRPTTRKGEVVKNPTLSEIRAEAYLSPIHVPYLLDLVKRMGDVLRIYDAEHSGCSCPACRKARELLKELKQ